MEDRQRTALQVKKEALKQKLAVAEAVKQLERDWLPVYESLLEAGAAIELEYLVCVEQEQKQLWVDTLSISLLARFNFPAGSIKVSPDYYVHQQTNLYPSTHPLRYLPDLKNSTKDEDAEKILQQAATDLGIKANDPVYVFFYRFPPVMRMQYSEVIKYHDLLYTLMEDVVVMPLDFQWIVFCSLEMEWRWSDK